MKATLPRLLFSTVAAAGLVSAAAHATTLGYNSDPAGPGWDRGDANAGYAIYDSFPALQFSNTTGTISNIVNSIFSQTLPATVGNGGAGLYSVYPSTTVASNGDVYFGGSNSILLTLSGTVTFGIRGLILQIKRPASQLGLHEGTVIVEPKLSINGVTGVIADGYSTAIVPNSAGDGSSATGGATVTSYYWGPSIAEVTQGGSNTYEVKIDQGAIQRGFDGFVLDAGPTSVVPEPVSATLLASGLGLLLARRRRMVAR